MRTAPTNRFQSMSVGLRRQHHHKQSRYLTSSRLVCATSSSDWSETVYLWASSRARASCSWLCIPARACFSIRHGWLRAYKRSTPRCWAQSHDEAKTLPHASDQPDTQRGRAASARDSALGLSCECTKQQAPALPRSPAPSSFQAVSPLTNWDNEVVHTPSQ